MPTTEPSADDDAHTFCWDDIVHAQDDEETGEDVEPESDDLDRIIEFVTDLKDHRAKSSE